MSLQFLPSSLFSPEATVFSSFPELGYIYWTTPSSVAYSTQKNILFAFVSILYVPLPFQPSYYIGFTHAFSSSFLEI